MLWTSLNFCIYETDFDPASYRSTLLLFCDSTHAPLFLFRVRTAQQSQTRSLLLAQFWTCRWSVQNLFLLRVHFLMLDGSFERKSSSEDRKAINMENLQLTQYFRSLQREKPISGLLSVQSVSPLRSSIPLHLSFATSR